MLRNGAIRQDGFTSETLSASAAMRWPTTFAGLRTSLQADERRRRWRLLGLVGALVGLAGLVLAAARLAPPSPTVQALREAEAAIALAQKLDDNWALFYDGDYQAASIAFQRALVQAPKNVEAHSGLGWSLHESGQAEAAQAIFEACVRLAPDNGSCLNGLAWSLASSGEVGEVERAVALWQGLLARGPDSAGNPGVIGLGFFYVERGDCPKAMPFLERLRWRRNKLAWVDTGLSRCEGASGGSSPAA